MNAPECDSFKTIYDDCYRKWVKGEIRFFNLHECNDVFNVSSIEMTEESCVIVFVCVGLQRLR